MKIYANDHPIENIKLTFAPENFSFEEQNNYLIESFFTLIDGWYEPYSIEFQIKSYESLGYGNYHKVTSSFYQAKQLTKENINQDILIQRFWENTQLINVKELNSENVKKHIDLKSQDSRLSEGKIGLYSVCSGTGHFMLPVNILSEDLILRNELNFETIYPTKNINNSTWVEAPQKKLGTLWPPIEFSFYHDGITLSLNLDLNWDLYSKRNNNGHQFLRKILNKMLEKGWTET